MKKGSAEPPTKRPTKAGRESRAARPARGSSAAASRSRARDVAADRDEIGPEYDFRGARPNPSAARYAVGATAVVLDPDVAAAFPTAARVNEVLRAVAGIIQAHPPAKPRRPRRSA